MVQNKGIIYKDVPTHEPEAGKHLTVEAREFDLNQAPPEGGITTKNYYASFDPYQRGRMKAPDAKHYFNPFTLGKPIENACISKVLKSDNSKFQEGDLISVMTGIEEYSAIGKATADSMAARKIENPYKLDPIIFLGALGMPGMTAYSSLYEIGKPKKGNVIFISAASGAVGQLVGQLAKHEGLAVFGSVGSDEKLKFILEDLGFDGGFNYKKEKPSEALARLAPKGLDIYYDNVGGEQLEAALGAMKDRGRIGKLDVFSPICLTFADAFQLLAAMFRNTTSRRRSNMASKILA